MSEFISLLIAGIVVGSIYAVSASGLVVTYNTTGIFNFAHGAMGMVLAYLFWQLWQGWGLPELWRCPRPCSWRHPFWASSSSGSSCAPCTGRPRASGWR